MSSNELVKALNLPVTVSMRRNPVTVSLTEPVSGLMIKMIEENIGAFIVVEGERPVGIITEKDMLARVVMNGKNMYKTKAGDVMSKPLISIEVDQTIKEALELMRNNDIRRLAVTENDSLVGLVTERRLLATIGRWIY